MGSVVDGGGGDLFKWIEINKRNNSIQQQSERSQYSSSSIERTKFTPYRP
jgi:hypothetical protein